MQRIKVLAHYLRIMAGVMIAAGLFGACGAPGKAQTTQTESYVVQFQIDKPASGNQTVTIDVHDRAGQAVDAESVVVMPLMESMGMTSPQSTAKRMQPGRYQAEYVYFSMAGEWEIDVHVRHHGKEEVARFKVQIP